MGMMYMYVVILRYLIGYAKMAEDVYEGVENALNVIVSTTGSSGNMKRELKTIIFDTVSNLRKLFAKLIEANENNKRELTEWGKNVAKNNEVRDKGDSRGNIDREETSSDPGGSTHCQAGSKVAHPGGGKVKLYSEAVEGKAAQRVCRLTVTSRDNQAAETIKTMIKSQIKPAELKVGIESIRTLRDRRVQMKREVTRRLRS